MEPAISAADVDEINDMQPIELFLLSSLLACRLQAILRKVFTFVATAAAVTETDGAVRAVVAAAEGDDGSTARSSTSFSAKKTVADGLFVWLLPVEEDGRSRRDDEHGRANKTAVGIGEMNNTVCCWAVFPMRNSGLRNTFD